jgi:hypothetical protein
VARIVPTVDRAKATVMTKVRFDQVDPRILPEMSAKVSLLAKRPSDADLQAVLAVNPRTVVERAGLAQVLRVTRDDTVEAITVRRLRTLGELVELEQVDAAAPGAPLRSGDRLVLAPDAKLLPGMKVKIAAAGGAK